MARAPQAIMHLWQDVKQAIPRAQLGGIVGDVNHSFGYHLARNELGGGDYSVQLAADRRGPSDAASALDVTLPADLMKTCTARLLAAAKRKDPRLKALREFCGTLNGQDTYPWDLSDNSSEGVGSWDDSHLWHIHLSFYREYADNYAALAPIASVMAGVAGTQIEEDPLADLTKAQLDQIGQAAAEHVWAHMIRGVDPHEQHAASTWLAYVSEWALSARDQVRANSKTIATINLLVGDAKSGILSRVAGLQSSVAKLEPTVVSEVDANRVAAVVIAEIKSMIRKAS